MRWGCGSFALSFSATLVRLSLVDLEHSGRTRLTHRIARARGAASIGAQSAREIVGHRQTEKDGEEEERGSYEQLRQRAAVLRVHEEQDDERGLGDRDADRHREVQAAE